MRHDYDTLIRKLADATQLDFYFVERMLKSLVRDVIREDGSPRIVPPSVDKPLPRSSGDFWNEQG